MNYYIPQWEERTSYGFRRIDPYAKLFEDRIIFLGTPISDDVANAVMAQLLCLESMNPDQDIQIYINSPGGSFTAMTAIYVLPPMIVGQELQRILGTLPG